MSATGEPRLFTVRSLDRINVEVADEERAAATSATSEFTASGGRKKKRNAKQALNWFNERSRCEKQLIVGVGILLAICCTLFITALVLLLRGPPYDESKVCRSEECMASAALVMQNMDLNADPCEDFYQYACGRFSESNPIVGDSLDINLFNLKRKKLDQEIKDFLEKPATSKDPLPVQQAKQLYDECLDLDAMDKEGMNPIFDLLKKVGLPLVPALFRFEDSAGESALGNWQWAGAAGSFTRWAGIDAIVGVYVTPDLHNSSLKRVKIYPPSWSTPYSFKNRKKYAKLMSDGEFIEEALKESQAERSLPGKAISLRKKYMRNVIEIAINATKENRTNTNQFERQEDEKKMNESLSAMDKALDKLIQIDKSLRTALNGSFREIDMQKFNLSDLQEFTDNITRENNSERKNLINWELLFSKVFEGTNVTTDKLGEIYIYAPYITHMTNVLANSSTSSVEAILWWLAIDAGVQHTTKKMRNTLNDYLTEFHGTRYRPRKRSDKCMNMVNKYFGVAVGHYFANPGFVNRSSEKIGTMYDGIKDVFKNRVRGLDWMDEITKQAVVEKAETTKINIGFPKEALNSTNLTMYYAGVEKFEKRDKRKFLSNFMKIVRFHYFEMFSRLNEPVNREEWASDPMVVNAFYSMETNLITVPAGILRFPFFDTGLDVLNYGGIGVILGHELTHGFDNTGRLYDANGNYRSWWVNDTADVYDNKTKCFVKHYGKLYIEELGFVDGRLTLGENIADNGGVRAAFESYQLLRKQKPDLKELLPGLEMLSPEKLFFIFYAGWSCQSVDKKAIAYVMFDPHSPSEARVWGAVSNSWIFANTFGCDFCSTMNPKKKCEIW
ncbi:Hypothetical predicted protein [Cloeon dipterum]|uniref:Peptidase M13 N-terminal domain-containing protein n=1 Tax=Cloeon dipterum TaxID=197152 RepID=A0A8S1DL63_9INSE|nr:Hypothetical predicted protein [Cloeon dipterum]